MTAYTAVMVAFTIVLAPVADLGWIYLGAAIVLGALFLGGTLALGRNPTPARSMRVFGYSITYVTVLFAAMTIDAGSVSTHATTMLRTVDRWSPTRCATMVPA